MLPEDRARRDEEVSAGFTSIGVTVEKLWGVEDQGPIGEFFSANRPLGRKTESAFGQNTFSEKENVFSAAEEENTLS